MKWKKRMKQLLFPPIALLPLLLCISTAWLLYALLFYQEQDLLRIVSYVLAFYTLIIVCLRIPRIIGFCKTIKQENPYIQHWLTDPRLQANVTLTGNVLWNGLYAALQFGLGLRHHLPWFYSLSAYYSSLAVMRFSLVRYTLHHEPGENKQEEWRHYRTCGWILLFLNLALSGMMMDMIWDNRLVRHHEITTIAMASYTFFTLSKAIINVFRYRKYQSPVLSASKVVSLVAACVSMLTLENTMLATFRTTELSPQMRRLFLGLSGGVISVNINILAIYMLFHSSQNRRGTEKKRWKKKKHSA